jgi:hypothetical protein
LFQKLLINYSSGMGKLFENKPLEDNIQDENSYLWFVYP